MCQHFGRLLELESNKSLGCLDTVNDHSQCLRRAKLNISCARRLHSLGKWGFAITFSVGTRMQLFKGIWGIKQVALFCVIVWCFLFLFSILWKKVSNNKDTKCEQLLSWKHRNVLKAIRLLSTECSSSSEKSLIFMKRQDFVIEGNTTIIDYKITQITFWLKECCFCLFAYLFYF